MYSRDTELRHLKPNDVYKFCVILEDNNCWKKLMGIIPKDLHAGVERDWKQTAVAFDLKYNNDHIRLIEDAIKRPGESRLYSQILFDEWGTSGRKHERPTVGVLLQLLVQAELFRAADFVALHFLNEPPPSRPLSGPAAKIDISLGDEIFDDIADMVNDSSYYPGTESLNDNANFANSFADNNKDFYSKYQRNDKSLATINEIVVEAQPPKAPPRTMRTARLQMQMQQQPPPQQQMDESEATTAEAFTRSKNNELQTQPNALENNFHPFAAANAPKFSALMTNDTISTVTDHNEFSYTGDLSEAPIPIISVLATATSNSITSKSMDQIHSETINSINSIAVLPIISALNLNGERDEQEVRDLRSRSNSSSNSSLSYGEDDDSSEKLEDNENVDDDDNSVPNLSIFDQRSSNNDSSLTTVTGTSSFELSLNEGSSSCSNENIPCLSALKQ